MQLVYKDLQNAMAALGSNVDFIIYLLADEDFLDASYLANTLTSLQPCKLLKLCTLLRAEAKLDCL